MEQVSNVGYWQKMGFEGKDVSIVAALQQLEELIKKVPAIFNSFSRDELLLKPAPGKWSRQEILGHLIDSALNNLKRFTEIQFLPQPYKVISYKQDELVEVNHYQSLPLAHLLDLWRSLNKQIVFVVTEIPANKLDFPVDPQYENGDVKTLGWIICDYVAHLAHHLKQL